MLYGVGILCLIMVWVIRFYPSAPGWVYGSFCSSACLTPFLPPATAFLPYHLPCLSYFALPFSFFVFKLDSGSHLPACHPCPSNIFVTFLYIPLPAFYSFFFPCHHAWIPSAFQPAFYLPSMILLLPSIHTGSPCSVPMVDSDMTCIYMHALLYAFSLTCLLGLLSLPHLILPRFWFPSLLPGCLLWMVMVSVVCVYVLL